MQALHRTQLPKFTESQKEELLNQTITFIRSRIQPQKLIAFGSICSEEFDALSDIDIVVIISDTQNPVEVRRLLYNGKPLPNTTIDFLVIRESDYERESQDGGIYFVAKTDVKLSKTLTLAK